MTDYLKTSREKSLSDDSNRTEAELIATQDGVREGWEDLQKLRAKIYAEKDEACKAVDAKYAAELKEAVDNYALLMSMSR